ncbi:LamG domain-containing protein [Streptomyces sp. NPDC055103]
MNSKESGRMSGRRRRGIVLRGAIAAAMAATVLPKHAHEGERNGTARAGSGRVARNGRLRGVGLLAVAVSSAVLAGALVGVQPAVAEQLADQMEPVAVGAPAQTEEQALAKARETGANVEVVDLRSERREVFANPDGSFTARQYTEPVRTVRDGKWVDIDTSLVRGADGRWTPKAATVGMSFSNGEAGKSFVTMNRAGREFSLTWPYGELAAPSVEGDTLTYANAIEGVDLVVRAEAGGFRHLLVVKTPEAAADPRLDRIELGMNADGLKMTQNATGALVATDAAVGGTVFETSAPTMWDSASVVEQAAKEDGAPAVAEAVETVRTAVQAPLEGAEGGGADAQLDIELSNGKLTLIPDQEMLEGASTVFPVVIDPVWLPSSRTSWTGVMSGLPSEQDWKYSDSAGVGRCPTDYNPVSCNGVGVRRVLFTMPLSFYKGKQILGATFSARVAHIYSASPTAEPIQLYRIGGKNRSLSLSDDWNSTQDEWSDYLQTVDKAISPTTCASSQANLHFEGGASGELTTEVKTAAAEGWDAMTLGLKAADESRFAEWKRICGNAYLSIAYNNLPGQIPTTKMSSNPGGACKWGAARPLAEELPKLRVYASDPDHGNGRTDKVKVQFMVAWTPVGSTTETYYTYDTGYLSPTSTTPFEHTVRSGIPENVVISWAARAHDGDGWGPWSNYGSPQRCEFTYDITHPGKPTIMSKEYPAGTVWHDGVGTVGNFTFAPNRNDKIADTDVVSYRYGFDSNATPVTSIAPAAAGGAATVKWMPTRSGRHWVDVIAVDRAGNPSSLGRHEFLVTEGRPVVAQWNLADKAGDTVAEDEVGDVKSDYSADKGPGVTFAVEGPGGKVDAAASFDGTSGAYLDATATVIDTSKSFTVSAWVRPTALDRNMTVLSQDGTGEPGFTLGYDAAAKTWAFSMASSDGDSLGDWKAAATGITPLKDQWILLTGVYDADKTGGPEMRLYINKDSRGTATRRSVWRSHGPMQIGRTTAKSGYRDYFSGDMAEVRVFDRILPPAQVAELMTVKPQRKGYWQLDTATGAESPETANGQALTLAGNAWINHSDDEVFDPRLVGVGHLELDGDGDYASTATPPITGMTSFTLTARVQLPSLSDKAQTVLSLPGANANRVQVRYRPGALVNQVDSRWELAVATEDTTVATVKTFNDDVTPPDTGDSGQHLAVVYDAVANDIRLYLNGEEKLAAPAHGTDNTLWPATRGLQVGRSLVGAPEYFAGVIDEVRVYNGAADPVAINQMAQTVAVPEM